jgi:hypothetical protein
MQWLKDVIAANDGDVFRAARGLEMDEAQLRCLVRGAYREVNLQTADRLFTATGHPELLAILYPQTINDLRDRWCDGCEEMITVSGDVDDCPWCVRPSRAQRKAARGLASVP